MLTVALNWISLARHVFFCSHQWLYRKRIPQQLCLQTRKPRNSFKCFINLSPRLILNFYIFFGCLLQLYFETFSTKDKGFFLKPFLQCGCILVSLFFGLNRVREHMHSWTDITAGFLLGGAVALFMVCFKIWSLMQNYSTFNVLTFLLRLKTKVVQLAFC